MALMFSEICLYFYWSALIFAKTTSSLETVEFPLLMPDVQPKKPDSYFCTSVEVDSTRSPYIVGFRPNATSETAHHILIYGCEEPGNKDEVWDCSEMSHSSRHAGLKSAPVCSKGAQVIYAWAHDASELTLPKGVGFKIGKKTNIKFLVLQVHYASVWRYTHEGKTDNSGIVLSLTEEKMPKLAGVFLLGTNGRILPRTKELFETACRISEDITLHPFAFRTHTHALGQAVSGYRVRRKGLFNNKWTLIGKKNPQLPQMFYPVDDPNMVLKKGDIVAARCTMNSKNRRRTTRIGPTSDDEMCNYYLMYWVDGDHILKQQYCFSWGPPFFYWSRYPLFNIPDDASIVIDS